MTKTTYQLCLSYLRYLPPEHRPEAANVVAKTAQYGTIGGRGSKEPDHAIDPIIEEVDLARALSMVGDPYLQAIGVDARRFQDSGAVVRRARAANPRGWEDLRRDRFATHTILVVPDGENFDVECVYCGYRAVAYNMNETRKIIMQHLDPLREALERCAVRMAAILGPSFGGNCTHD